MTTRDAENSELFTRRAPKGATSTWNASTRTFRATIAASAAVRRYDAEGEYFELLDHEGVELPSHIPLLNAHRSGDVSDVIGTVEGVERIGAHLEAVLRLSARTELAGVATDVRDGVLSGTSIGYVVHEWREEEDDDGRRTKTAVRWRLIEASIVPVPADDAARIRSKNMEDENEIDDVAAPTLTRSTEYLKRHEVTRRSKIRELADRLGVREFADQHLARGTSIDEFRTLLIDHLADEEARHQMPHVDPMAGSPSPATRSVAMAEALAARIDNTITPSAHARSFVGLSMHEMAKEHLHGLGIDTRARGRSWIVQEALNTRGVGGLHSTSDFSHVLSDAVGRVLRKAYEAAPSGSEADRTAR